MLDSHDDFSKYDQLFLLNVESYCVSLLLGWDRTYMCLHPNLFNENHIFSYGLIKRYHFFLIKKNSKANLLKIKDHITNKENQKNRKINKTKQRGRDSKGLRHIETIRNKSFHNSFK